VGVEVEKGLAEWIILHVENDRGGGVPLALASLATTIPADKVRAGAVLTGESINLREVESMDGCACNV